MLLKSKVKTLYYTDEGVKSEAKTENFVKMKTKMSYRQATILYQIMADPKFKVLFGGKKVKEQEQTEALMELIPAFIKLLSTTVIEWSAKDEEGNPLPINEETLEDLEYPIIMDLINTLMMEFSATQQEAAKAEDEVKN